MRQFSIFRRSMKWYSLIFFVLVLGVLSPYANAKPPHFDDDTGLELADGSPLFLPDGQTQAELEQMCAAIVARNRTSIQDYFAKNGDVILTLRDRVLGPDPTNLARDEFYTFLEKFIRDFQMFTYRIERSKRFDGKYVANNFLRGVTIWSQDLQDLKRALGVFYRYVPESVGQKHEPDADIQLELFSARMAWLAYAYDVETYQNREKALRRLDDFDAMCKDMNLAYDATALHATSMLRGPRTIETLIGHGLRPPKAPITKLGLEFNNGLLFSFAGFSGSRRAELWAAKMLTIESPRELILSLDDPSSRQFYHIFRNMDGVLGFFPRAVDYIFLEQDAEGWFVRLRELKFTDPEKYIASIPAALEQLRSSWIGWELRYGKVVPVETLEIVIPTRDRSKVGRTLGGGYRLGAEIGSGPNPKDIKLHRLLYQGKPISVEYDGRSIEVWVRELDITREKYLEINDLRRQIDTMDFPDSDEEVPLD